MVQYTYTPSIGNRLKRAKQTTKTTQLVLVSETDHQLSSNIALGLLLGGYNPLRRHSKDGQPIDLDKLKALQERFSDLIHDVQEVMNVNIWEVENF